METLTQLCPYPGLRPFDEKESIFFKGREKNIDEIILQLEQKRFVMITGSSGDGKSSIVYAGVIPNIKAGFVKANYNAWRFSIIKPEDKPLRNLSNSLAEIFNENPEKVYEDLSYGFSSIVEFYKNSEFYIDSESKEWQDLPLEGKKLRRAKAANLFILVDQFEEFFTNTENIYNGEPSIDAETAMNLIVETVRIANEEKLPIYIICTMRSDFIGNSASFRGLPELIGFSHFFTPRLNREEIEKIILEPALLNGDSISDQLVNHLSSAAIDGTDQLPIIQHALNRIWNIAQENNEEMDLIHLAMDGGMDYLELGENERKRFKEFYKTIPEHKKTHFQNPSLQNVINSHADELLEESIKEFKQIFGNEFSDEILLFVLKRSFQTLTKVDEGRSVRHRSSVRDLIGSINIPEIGLNEINQLLKKFREAGNTFLNPFESVEAELNYDSVLDITHEALIRNWDKLKQWSEEDEQNLNDYIDFNKQLHRWEENKKAKEFLLSLGPLEQFETWYKNSNTNIYWIVKYDDSNTSAENKLLKAGDKVSSIENYLSQSREYLNSIEAAKKKRNKNILAASIAIIILLSGLTIWAISQKNYASKQEKVAMQKMTESEASKKQAMRSKEEAEKARIKAQQNEHDALNAKQESEQSAKNAMAQKHIAEQATVLAQTKSIEAKKEAERANSEMESALIAKDEAKAANQKVLRSEIKSKNVTSKTLSQQMAYMAASNSEGDTSSTLFAMHAWDLHKEVNGKVLDPIIYNGLIQANYFLSGKDCFNFKDLVTAEQQIVAEINDSLLFTISAYGRFYLWNKLNNSSKYYFIKDYTPFENVYLEQKTKTLFVENKAGTIAVFSVKPDISTVTTQFENFSGMMRGAMQTGENEKYLIVSKIGMVFIYNKKEKIPEKIVELNEEVISFSSLDKNSCLIGTTKGNIYQVNSSGEKSLLYFNDKQKERAYSLETDNIGKIVFVGFSDGRIKKFSYQNFSLKLKEEFKVSKTIIKKLSYNENSSILAAASADNKIWIIDYKHDTGKPVYIDFSAKTKAIYVDDAGDVFATFSDLTFRKFHSDCGLMYKELCDKIKRDLTQDEWTKYFGEDIEFNPLNCKK